jgi:hypothetical protein
MGKEWDKFRVDKMVTARWRGERAGDQGKLSEKSDSAFGRVAYGGTRPKTSQRQKCGKRDAFRNPHPCGGDEVWQYEVIDKDAAPPSLLAFGEWCRLWAVQAIRVLKPGGYLLAFGGSRTYHRMACAIEDAGFDIRDQIMWIYGSGFPKSLNVGVAVDKAVGGVRDVVGYGPEKRTSSACLSNSGQNKIGSRKTFLGGPASEQAGEWEGWGTALKPAFEPLVMDQKPRTWNENDVCDCVDSRVGRDVGNEIGRGDRKDVGLQRSTSVKAQAADGHSVVQEYENPGDGSVRDVPSASRTESQGCAEIQDSVLLGNVCEPRAEETRFGNAEIRAGVESGEGQDSSARSDMPNLSSAQPGSSPSSTVQVWRIERRDESGRTVRLVPSPNRGNNEWGAEFDPDRNRTRGLLSFHLVGRQEPVVWLCSWCGRRVQDIALTPPHEPIVMARKPLSEKSVAANVLKWGTGAINVDGCRLAAPDADLSLQQNQHEDTAGMRGLGGGGFDADHSQPMYSPKGRWPANVVLIHHEDCELIGQKRVPTGTAQKANGSDPERAKDWMFGGLGEFPPGTPDAGYADADVLETVDAWDCAADCPVKILDDQSGESKGAPMGTVIKRASSVDQEGNTGSVFAQESRPAGTVCVSHGPPLKDTGGIWSGESNIPCGATYEDRGGASRFFYTGKANRQDRHGSKHPTIKPIATMQWLIKMVTPAGGVVLDPFLGSGTTVAAARAMGVRSIGIERDAKSVEDAIARLEQTVLW